MLEDLAEYDYHCWNAPRDYYSSEDILYNSAQWQDHPSPQLECFPEFQAEVAPIPEATWHYEGDQRNLTLELLQANLNYLQLVLSRMPVPQDNSIAAMSRRDELQRAQLEIDDIQRVLSRLNTPPICFDETVIREVECESRQKPSTSWGLCEMLDDDDLSEEETQAWMESEEPHRETSFLEIHIIMRHRSSMRILMKIRCG